MMNQVHELNFFFSETVQRGSVAHRASYSMGTEVISQGWSSQGTKLITHLH